VLGKVNTTLSLIFKKKIQFHLFFNQFGAIGSNTDCCIWSGRFLNLKYLHLQFFTRIRPVFFQRNPNSIASLQLFGKFPQKGCKISIKIKTISSLKFIY
jgi:hypothetical protein